MIELVIGALGVAALVLLISYARSHQIQPAWWGWTLTVLGVIYAVFFLEVVIAFLSEGAPQAALVVGILLGTIAMIWGVLLGRFVFTPQRTGQH